MVDAKYKNAIINTNATNRMTDKITVTTNQVIAFFLFPIGFTKANL